MRLTITAAATVRANLQRRQLAGTVFRYGEVGATSAGPLRVSAPGALLFPDDLTTVALTREHDRSVVRGHLVLVDDSPERLYVVVQVADGPEGDAALAEAADRTRGALSFDLEDADVVQGAIVRAGVHAIGQVREPAYNSARIDQIAASKTTGASRTNTTGGSMTPEQIARLAELRSLDTLTPEQQAELDQLVQLEESTQTDASAADAGDTTPPAAPAPTTASRRVPAVPSGVPGQGAARQSQGSQLQRFYEVAARAMAPGGGGAQAITAAFQDVTNSGAGANIAAPAWSGELWSGLQYEPEWSNLFSTGPLDSYSGKGWRWVQKPIMQDYAGDKAAVPSNAVTTEPSEYEAARMACGHDLDRKFYDFNDTAFLASYAEAAREDWAVKLDAKVRAYTLAEAVAYGTVQDSLLKAAALAAFGVKSNTRAKATFVKVNDADFLNLLDITNDNLPALLDMFGIDPKNFGYDAAVPAGTVVAGVKQAATVRTLPGSPIRVDAQHLANGGVDSAFFGYWAIEQHHTAGIVKTTFA